MLTVRRRYTGTTGSFKAVCHMLVLGKPVNITLQAFARFDMTLMIQALGRVASLVALIKACRLVPLPDIITVIRTMSLHIMKVLVIKGWGYEMMDVST